MRRRAFSFSGRSAVAKHTIIRFLLGKRCRFRSDGCHEHDSAGRLARPTARRCSMSAKVSPERGRPGTAGNKTKVQPIVKSVDVLEKGLPSNLDAERFVLASVLLDDHRFIEVAALKPDDFSLERHRRIFGCMQDLQARSEHVDRLTVAEELARRNELGPDGLGYLVSLDDGMPRIAHLESYARIVLDKSRLRRTIFTAQKLMNECLLETAATNEILATHLAEIQELSQSGSAAGKVIADIPSIRECGGAPIEYLRAPELPKGAVIAFTGDSGSGKSTLLLSWAGEISAAGTPVLILDRDNPISAIVERFD